MTELLSVLLDLLVSRVVLIFYPLTVILRCSSLFSLLVLVSYFLLMILFSDSDLFLFSWLACCDFEVSS